MAKGELMAVGSPEELMRRTESESLEDAFIKIVEGGSYEK